MGYKDHTYVIFDGDNDHWAYGFMKGWKSGDHIDFDFDDAHKLFPLTYRAQDESYIKGKLIKRLAQAKQIFVLVGESTRYLYKYVRWELDVALEFDLPIIVVNLNNNLDVDINFCPPILRNQNVIHIPFKMAAIKYALDDFPAFYRKTTQRGPWIYPDSVYRSLGIL
jgi:hypothetical protein